MTTGRWTPTHLLHVMRERPPILAVPVMRVEHDGRTLYFTHEDHRVWRPTVERTPQGYLVRGREYADDPDLLTPCDPDRLVRILIHGGEHWVAAAAVHGVFAVHRTPFWQRHNPAEARKPWSLTHIPSGIALRTYDDRMEVTAASKHLRDRLSKADALKEPIPPTGRTPEQRALVTRMYGLLEDAERVWREKRSQRAESDSVKGACL